MRPSCFDFFLASLMVPEIIRLESSFPCALVTDVICPPVLLLRSREVLFWHLVGSVRPANYPHSHALCPRKL